MTARTPAPYAPVIDYLCDDFECCLNGCPVVTCRVCGKEWPCPAYRENHTAPQIAAQERYVKRVWDR